MFNISLYTIRECFILKLVNNLKNHEFSKKNLSENISNLIVPLLVDNSDNNLKV